MFNPNHPKSHTTLWADDSDFVSDLRKAVCDIPVAYDVEFGVRTKDGEGFLVLMGTPIRYSGGPVETRTLSFVNADTFETVVLPLSTVVLVDVAVSL